MGRLAACLPLLSVAICLMPDSAQTPAMPTLKAKARIVVIDVTVTDAEGHPVRNLKASDFTLKEDGVQQPITHFEEVAAKGAQVNLPPLPKLAANEFTNYTRVPPGALTILLLDALNTPPEDQLYERAELLKFLATVPSGTRMAIFGLNSELKLLRGFTSDPDVLRNALTGKKRAATGAAWAKDSTANPQPQPDFFTGIMDGMGNDPSSLEVDAMIRDISATLKSYELQTRIGRTIDALNSMAHYLAGLPGRKNLLWFSGSFPINVLPDGAVMDHFDGTANFENEFHETTSLLASSRVAVFPNDALGLRLGPQQSSTSLSNLPAASAAVMIQEPQKFFEDTASNHATMREMANATGGVAYIDTNGLAVAAQKAIDAGSNFYSLTYSPSDPNWKGDFRRVQVQLAQAGLKLTYRHGYFADNINAQPAGQAATQTAAGTSGMIEKNAPETAMRAAMQFGGPDPTEILFKAAINPASTKTEPSVAAGNVPDPEVLGPFRRYVIYIAALPTDFTVTPLAAGRYRIGAEMVTDVYDENGAVLNQARLRATGDFDEEKYKALMRSGLQFRQEISVPSRGQSFLRVALHDLATDRVGAIEVAVARLIDLKPLAKSSESPK
jgi:VWFA-related protein